MNRVPRVVSVLSHSLQCRLVGVRAITCLSASLNKPQVNSSIFGWKFKKIPRGVLWQQRDFSAPKSSSKNKEGERTSSVIESFDEPQTQMTVGAKVVQAGRDVTYLGVIILGFAVTGALLWFVVSELIFGFSPNKVYSDALKKIRANYDVAEVIGEPIKGYGETTSRGRRRHVSHQEYIVDGEDYMRVKFYVSGPKGKATAHVDVKRGSGGSYDYRFILVEPTQPPSRTIIVLDNR